MCSSKAAASCLARYSICGAIDEVHVFIAPKFAGGAGAPSPVGGAGVERMASALKLADIAIEELEGDVYVHGRVGR